jgi:hypothetical protein
MLFGLQLPRPLTRRESAKVGRVINLLLVLVVKPTLQLLNLETLNHVSFLVIRVTCMIHDGHKSHALVSGHSFLRLRLRYIDDTICNCQALDVEMR